MSSAGYIERWYCPACGNENEFGQQMLQVNCYCTGSLVLMQRAWPPAGCLVVVPWKPEGLK